jgi:uncharacterized protein
MISPLISDELELVCCGHDHRAYVEQVANVAGSSTWLANPGTVAGLYAPATGMLADLDALHFEIRKLTPARLTLISS